jgi:hypothetical protein
VLALQARSQKFKSSTSYQLNFEGDMNDYHVYNSNLIVFLLAMICKGITEGVGLFFVGCLYLWEPACKRCEDKEVDCIAKSKPCHRQRSQKTTRLITVTTIVVVPLLVWLLVGAIKKDNERNRSKDQQIQQLLDAQKPK